MKFIVKRFPVLTGKPMYGRIFAVQRDGRYVFKISVVPRLSPGKKIEEYAIKMAADSDLSITMPADQALELSQVLSTAYSHARRLEKRYLGMSIESQHTH